MANNYPKVLLKDHNPEELVLTFAGNIVKHLGVQMYAGRPVPAIAELISNAWDADATNVEVTLPLDSPWEPTKPNQLIQVSDDGNGMTWEMVRDSYLDVGRDRREAERTDRTSGGRLLQGRKGVGKLSGFGIADVMEVMSVFKNNDPKVGEKVLIWFSLSLADLRKITKNTAAPVNVIYAGPVSKAPKGGRTSKGTTIILKQLHGRKAINADRFHHSIAQRFLFIGPKFRVQINDQDLRAEDIKLQWRWPEKGWGTEDVKGCGPVQYWIGFTQEPRRQNEGELSGILIYTRDKISQESTFFDISGGVTGQHGLRYMVGMVKAEWLDSGVDAPDLIATHRGSIAWESPQGAAFQEWGQSTVKKYLAEWAKKRAILRESHIKNLRPAIKARIEHLTPAYKDVALKFFEKFKTIEMEPEEFEDILSWFLDALENATLRSILQKLQHTDIADLEKLDDLLSKMEVRTAVTLLQIIDGNIAAIDALERMHKNNASERAIISKHLAANPWLLDPTWILNKPEARVSTWIKKEFKLEPKGDSGDKRRVDFFCVGVGGTLHIVEIKRGAHIAAEKDFLQAEKYRKYVEKRFKELSDPKAIKYHIIQSHLIASELKEDAESIKTAFANNGWVFFTTWDDLIERSKITHTQFREILEARTRNIDIESNDDAPPITAVQKASTSAPQRNRSRNINTGTRKGK